MKHCYRKGYIHFAIAILVTVAAIIFGAMNAKAATISDLASQMVGHPVKVTCHHLPNDDLGESYATVNEYGEISFSDDIALSPATCVGIKAFKSHHIHNAFNAANALETLLHESMHIRLSSDNESLVECTAMLNLWNWITSFHYSKKTSKNLYQLAWNGHWALPNQYLQTGYGCDYQGMNSSVGPVER